MSEQELQGDDPTLIAIIASAHGYYVDDFSDAPIEVPVRIIPSGANIVLLRLAPTTPPTVFHKTLRWHNVVYGFHRAA